MSAEAERGIQPPGEAEPWARIVLEETRQLVALIDRDGVLLAASRPLLVAVGADPAQIIGRPLETARRWADSPRARERLRAAIADVGLGRTMVYEIQGPATDGTA